MTSPVWTRKSFWSAGQTHKSRKFCLALIFVELQFVRKSATEVFLPLGHLTHVDTSWSQVICRCVKFTTFCKLATHRKVRTQSSSFANLRRLASPFGQGLISIKGICTLLKYDVTLGQIDSVHLSYLFFSFITRCKNSISTQLKRSFPKAVVCLLHKVTNFHGIGNWPEKELATNLCGYFLVHFQPTWKHERQLHHFTPRRK